MSPRSDQAKTAMVTTLAAVLLVGVVAAAAIFSIARGASDLAVEGTTGILAEATLSAAAATHNAVSQAQVVAEGEQLGVATHADVVSSLSRSDEALQELRNRTEQLAAEVPDGNDRSRIVQESRGFVATATAVIGDIRNGELVTSLATIDGEFRGGYEALVTTLAELRNDAFSEITLARNEVGRLADAARFMVVLLIPVAILLTFRSRTRRLHAQRELQAELEKQQAISRTKSDFIAHMSHQLRTPLTGIYGSALELNDPEITANIPLSRELTKMITEESAELARMVEDILTVAAEDQDQLTVELRSIDPVAEINGLLEPLELIGSKTQCELEPGVVLADPRHFRQATSNLVSNAHRYGADPVIVHGHLDAGRYHIEVIDHGSGVDEDAAERMFNRFVHEGDSPLITGRVGLGLAVAEILITRMNGEIDYTRRNGTTVFSISLPLAER